MILDNFKSFPKTGKILAIDWGGRRIGLAVCDESRNFTFARSRIDNRFDLAKTEIKNFVEYERIVGIILGLPLRLNGEDSDTTRKVRQFAIELETVLDIPIALFDESLTSFEASESGADKDHIDSESARLLLENAINLISRM
jgi:putative Holliday junction resolvase